MIFKFMQNKFRLIFFKIKIQWSFHFWNVSRHFFTVPLQIFQNRFWWSSTVLDKKVTEKFQKWIPVRILCKAFKFYRPDFTDLGRPLTFEVYQVLLLDFGAYQNHDFFTVLYCKFNPISYFRNFKFWIC